MKKNINFSFIANSAFLIVGLGFSYFWVNDPTISSYTLQLIGLLVIVYFGNYFLNTKRGKVMNKKTLVLDAVIFTMITYLLVSTTGYFSSPFFFLFYFLAFGVALLFEPAIAVVLMVLICLSLVGKIGEGGIYGNIAKLGSLVLVSPLAIFFGRGYLKTLEADKKIKILETWGKKVEKDLKENDKKMSETEEDTLLFLSLDLKEGLTNIYERCAGVMSGKISYIQKEEMERIRKEAKRLLEKANKLKEGVDERTDEDF